MRRALGQLDQLRERLTLQHAELRARLAGLLGPVTAVRELARPSLDVVQSASAAGRGVEASVRRLVGRFRAWVFGPVARWACPAAGGLLVGGGLLGLLLTGGR